MIVFHHAPKDDPGLPPLGIAISAPHSLSHWAIFPPGVEPTLSHGVIWIGAIQQGSARSASDARKAAEAAIDALFAPAPAPGPPRGLFTRILDALLPDKEPE